VLARALRRSILKEAELPDFFGKLLLLYLSDAPKAIENGVFLEFASFTEYGGRLFLIGRVPSVDNEDGDWVANLQGGISWDSVRHYLVFASREDYLQRMENARIPLVQRVLRMFGLA